MALSDYLVLGFAQYGSSVLFVVVLLAAIGLPLPATLLLLTAGAWAAQGSADRWSIVALAACAAVLGDHIGYVAGRWGSGRLVARMERRAGGAGGLRRAERWGGTGIFLSRWLLTPIGPAVNLVSGLARYPWPCFFALAAAGEALWATAYVLLGSLFADQLQALSSNLSYVSWFALGLLAIAAAAKLLARRLPVVAA